MRSRAGKFSASENAAASDTTPRMPAHDTTIGYRQGGACSRSRIRRENLPGR